MATVIISIKNDPKLYKYDSVMRSIRSEVRKDSSYICSDDEEIRIDVMPLTKYHARYSLDYDLINMLTDELDSETIKFHKNQNIALAILVADSLKGYVDNKSFLYNTMAIQKYTKEYILDTFHFTTKDGIMKVKPDGSEEETFNTRLFSSYNMDTYFKVRSALDIHPSQDVTHILEEYNLDKDTSYIGFGSYSEGLDDVKISNIYAIKEQVYDSKNKTGKII